MFDENGIVMTEKQIMKEALELLSDVCGLLFETESDNGHAAAFMADSLIKFLQVAYRDDNILSAAADYNSYENEVYLRKKQEMGVNKDL